MKQLHFISGLPRSGSTLLSSILRQNPRFHAGITSPVSTLFQAVENATSNNKETTIFVGQGRREALLKDTFHTYYKDTKNEVVFDTSRLWCARVPLLARLFPKSKMIVCVREVGWILDSFEKLYRKNNMEPSGIYGWDTSGTVYSRTSALAQAGGVVGFAINAVQEAVASEESADYLKLVDYETLCKHPEKVLREIYEFIGEEWFEHDFSDVAFEAGEFDRQLGADGLHTVKAQVAWTPRKTILPQPLFDQFNGPNFWRKS